MEKSEKLKCQIWLLCFSGDFVSLLQICARVVHIYVEVKMLNFECSCETTWNFPALSKGLRPELPGRHSHGDKAEAFLMWLPCC